MNNNRRTLWWPQKCSVAKLRWRLTRLALTISVLLTATLYASPLDRSALVGTWEGITPYGNELVHIEITGDKDSFLAFIPNLAGSDFKHFVGGGSGLIYRLQSVSIEGRRVTLRFLPHYPNFPNEITISGKFYEGDITGGVIAGTMTRRNRLDKNQRRGTWNFALRKGNWTRNFDFLSKFAEEAVKKAKAEASF